MSSGNNPAIEKDRGRFPRSKNVTTSVIESIKQNYIGPRSIPTKKEQYALVKRIRKGDRVALQELVVRNLPFVVAIAYKYRNNGVEVDDLITEGVLGLMKAIEKFDLKRNLALSTYAMYWIKESIIRAIADKGSTIRRPVHAREKMRKAGNIAFSPEHSSGEQTSIDERAVSAGLDPVQIRELLRRKHASETVPIPDLPEGFEDRNKAVSSGPTQFEDLLRQEIVHGLAKLLETLTERERIVISLRFGLESGEGLSLDQVGEIMGVTKERVRQIQVKAMRKLQFRVKYTKTDLV